MTGQRLIILISMMAGLIWAFGVLWVGHNWLTELGSRLGQWEAMAVAGFLIGVILIAMIGRLAQRRFFDDALINGQAFAPESAADIDQRVLINTVEQAVLAVCIWPLVGVVHGAGVVIALGIGFAVARILFWAGYHWSPPLRGFGFAATFYPTVLSAVWTVLPLWR